MSSAGFGREMPSPPAGKEGWPWVAPEDLGESKKQLAPTAWPKISIVIPTLNMGIYLEECIRSILLQGYPALELIVIDGGSTDSSVEIIGRYEKFISYWVSERDSGQSNAINKGVAHVTGDLVNWLNADDILLPGALQAIANAYLPEQRNQVVLCPVRNIDASSGRSWIVDQSLLQVDPVRFWRYRKTYHQPGVFIGLALWNECGGLDESLVMCMDYDLYCKLATKAKFISLDFIVAEFRVHKDQKTARLEDVLIIERCIVSKRYWQRQKVGWLDARRFDVRVAKSISHRVNARRQSLIESARSINRLCSATGVPFVLSFGRLCASRLRRRLRGLHPD